MTVIDRIEIGFQNLILGKMHFQPGSVHRFLQLSGPGLIQCQKQIAGNLLGDGAAPFHDILILQVD